MSDDATYILRRGGVTRFFYARRGGSHIDRALLAGPRGLLPRFNGEFQPVPAPVWVRWLSGALLIDLDQQAIWFWSSQDPATSSLRQRLLDPLLAAPWPGWTLHRLTHPAAQLAVLLPDHPPTDALQPPTPLSPADFAQAQAQPWRDALASQDLSADIATCGEAMVRSWFECTSHRSVACIVTPGGVHETTFDDGWDTASLLRTGPAGLAALQDRPAAPLEDTLHEDEIQSAYWLDPAAQRLLWWQARPAWADHPLLGLAERWPGWQAASLEGGAPDLLRRLGRSPGALRPADAEALLRDMLDRLLPTPSPLQQTAAALLAQVCAPDQAPDGL